MRILMPADGWWSPGDLFRCALSGLVVVVWLGLLAACGEVDSTSDLSVQTEQDSPAVQVVATTRPLCWIVARLSEGQAECRVFGSGQHPAELEPSADQLLVLGRADLILVNGAGLESWLASASLPASRLVVTSSSVDLVEVEGDTHSHGPEGEHSHKRTDPYLWQDPLAMIEQARVIASALERELEDTGVANRLEQLSSELSSLADRISTELSALSGQHVASVDPGFLYLARRAGVELREFERGDSGTLSHHDLEHLGEWLEESPVKIVLADSSRKIELDGLGDDIELVGLDSLLGTEQEAGTYDYLEDARLNLEALSAAVNR